MREVLDLAGEWKVALDRHNEGIRARWFADDLKETMYLPGSTDQARIGDLVDERRDDRLSRIWRWVGPAWYQRDVDIPGEWHRKHITLLLERTKDSQVWVDGTWAGSDDSLSAPHVFDLSKLLTPGPHTITVLIDNAKLPPVGPCHQIDERTQTNWNGILGRMELTATDRVWIEDVQAYPDVGSKAVRVVATIGNASQGACPTEVTAEAGVVGRPGEFDIAGVSTSSEVKTGTTKVECDMKLPDDIPLWDEFDRPLIELTVGVRAEVGGAPAEDELAVTFGMRDFGTKGGQFVVNGRPIFLRGKNDSALFPITGYAPMDKEYWLHHLGIAADYGINHYRFHSWCPPEAAFRAADELGIYFQVELPNKTPINAPSDPDYAPPKEAYETLDELRGDGGDPAVRTAYLTREGERILKSFGNHPSFVMMTLGNEIGGDPEVMKGMTDHFRSLDGRHLYAMGTNHFHWGLKHRAGDDFWVIKGTSEDKHVRGASWNVRCHIDHAPPTTTFNYEDRLGGIPVPVVGHEIAQFEVYPDYSEIEKYTGVLRARNLETFRDRLEAAGMLDQASDFQKASGATSLICHREDVEAALRTRGFGGFQMLDLQDFSGQGTALVGLLDVFMDSKGLVTPRQWREFCCETVPLLGMAKYTWTNDEAFRAWIRVAHYGARDLKSRSLKWKMGAGPEEIASGETEAMDIPTGTVTEVGAVEVDLASVTPAQKLVVALEIPGTEYRNRCDVWVYPREIDTAVPDGVVIARSFTREVEEALAAGKTVLFMPRPDSITKSVAMAFQTGFWSPMFRRPDREPPLGETPGTQGILCDPQHPMFEDFPTEFYSNWQWWQLVKHSRAMILDDTPRRMRPVVQVVDGIDRNHKLGLVFEARVGKGRLLVCSMDLPALQEHPEARQLLRCIQQYAASAAFEPQTELSADVVKGIL